MLLAVNINFVVFLFSRRFTWASFHINRSYCCSCKSALGLAILIVYYRVRGGIALDTVQTLRS